MSFLKRTLIVAVLLTVTTGALGHANDQEQESIALKWIEAHNSGDVATMAALRGKHYQRSDVVDWQDNFANFVEQFGQLEIHGLMIERSNQIKIAVHSAKLGERLELVFDFHEDAPDQIRRIGVEGEGGNSALKLELPDSWDERVPAIDEFLQKLADDGVFSGVVLVGDLDKIEFEGAYGLASREFNVPNTMKTRFDVGSCTKDYTQTAILQLQAQGKLSVNDFVGTHLPNYPNKDVRQGVTIQQLLDHRSGLGDYFTDEWLSTPMGNLREINDYIPIWGPKPLLAKPGEREIYSNFGYTVLGAIIEAVSKQSYTDYIIEHVFKPAGMVDTGFFEVDAIVPNVAVGYTQMSLLGPLPEPRKNIYAEPAKGGPWGKSYSTAHDVYRFFQAMRDGALLDDDSNWLRGGLANHSGVALAGGGPGMSAVILFDGGNMVIALANMDMPIAEDVASALIRAIR